MNYNKCGLSPLHDYRVLKYLGSGSFGSVYKIENKYSRKTYAIKDIVCPNEESVTEQKKEISNLQRVDSE